MLSINLTLEQKKTFETENKNQNQTHSITDSGLTGMEGKNEKEKKDTEMIRCIYKMIAIDKSNYSCDKHRVMWYYHAPTDGASSYISNISSSSVWNGDETNTKSKLAEKSKCVETANAERERES